MKAMEKRVKEIENCQFHLKKRARKQKAMEERLDDIEKEMKKHEREKENNDGFDYQTMKFDWNGGRYDSNGVDATIQKPEDADIVENIEVVEELEGQRGQGQKIYEKESEEEVTRKIKVLRKRTNLKLKFKLKRFRKKIKVLKKRKNRSLKQKLKKTKKVKP